MNYNNMIYLNTSQKNKRKENSYSEQKKNSSKYATLAANVQNRNNLKKNKQLGTTKPKTFGPQICK